MPEPQRFRSVDQAISSGSLEQYRGLARARDTDVTVGPGLRLAVDGGRGEVVALVDASPGFKDEDLARLDRYLLGSGEPDAAQDDPPSN